MQARYFHSLTYEAFAGKTIALPPTWRSVWEVIAEEAVIPLGAGCRFHVTEHFARPLGISV